MLSTQTVDRNLQPGQILYLEHNTEHKRTRLYTEAIQIVTARQLCWARPIALLVVSSTHTSFVNSDILQLVTVNGHTNSHTNGHTADPLLALYDLRQDSDLLLPLCLFYPALDTEVIPILTQLEVQCATQVSRPVLTEVEVTEIEISEESVKNRAESLKAASLSEDQPAHHHLQNFIRQLCYAHPEAF